MRTRKHHQIRGITLMIASVLALIGFPVMSLTTENLTFGQGMGMGLFAGFLFFVVGMINYKMYQSDFKIEASKDARIKELEEELKKHEDRRYE